MNAAEALISPGSPNGLLARDHSFVLKSSVEVDNIDNCMAKLK